MDKPKFLEMVRRRYEKVPRICGLFTDSHPGIPDTVENPESLIISILDQASDHPMVQANRPVEAACVFMPGDGSSEKYKLNNLNMVGSAEIEESAKV